MYRQQDLTLESQEILSTLAIELLPYPEDMTSLITVDERPLAGPTTPVSELLDIIARDYSWALDVDLSAPGPTTSRGTSPPMPRNPAAVPCRTFRTCFDDMTLDLPQKLQELVHCSWQPGSRHQSVGSFLRLEAGIPRHRGTDSRSSAAQVSHGACEYPGPGFQPRPHHPTLQQRLLRPGQDQEDGPVGVVGRHLPRRPHAPPKSPTEPATTGSSPQNPRTEQ
jgi:hypothetical protein